MKRLAIAFTALVAGSTSLYAHSSDTSCREVHWKPGKIIAVHSAMNLGTRVDLPSDLVTAPVAGNQELWNVEGAADQVLIKPNSAASQGERTVVRAFTKDGHSYDIAAKRVKAGHDDICVTVQLDGEMFSDDARSALETLSSRRSYAQANAAGAAQAAQLRKSLLEQAQSADEEKRKAVMEALRRFRYHIYTRYDWSGDNSFATHDLISDVYDDGRFTYIRLHNPNRGLLSVETIVGGKTAIVPTKYDDAYGMYRINGIYPEFTLRIDEAELTVSRADAKTHGEF
ncbi:hypothetical protein RE428_48890 (plasmid) [Marinobacter nanhaiticus D15-8W]|uniref:Conjugal transfer protein n=1 Tax=Marinobacter nanhaiticus D15-8W TaxID=626887 RepID=N6X7M0_9GAMM|nr:TrbG/VirB9 family P-type conjugative transfer protein [Marinobacter nanhaiticus]ENO17143.1 hypothetical protein J057_00719 [Marinobacter nanhaiticus D15-8W]BES73871.1 hypothetical protein RE428_48890 [Marinobacter nanhaiticus D15-8W]